VFELDGQLVDLIREHLDLDGIQDLRVHVRDGRSGITAMPEASTDLVVLDVFQGGDPVTELSTVEFLQQIARVLRPGGLYATNLWGAADLAFVLRATAAITEVFPHVLAFAEAAVFMKHRPGNVVIAASTSDLPAADLNAWAADNHVSLGPPVASPTRAAPASRQGRASVSTGVQRATGPGMSYR